MNQSTSIIEFNSLDEIKEEIIEDLNKFNISANRYPVRFIFLNSHAELKKVASLLIEHAQIVELSSWLRSDESWFTGNQITKKIKNLDKSSVILPLSEFIRFSKDEEFTEILNQLATIENSEGEGNLSRRIYIPLVGVWERFYDLFWKSFYKKDNWVNIWKFNSDVKSIKIFQVNFI